MAERRTIFFSGRVQGVGFRMTAVHLAADLAVSGTVRNLPDGRVELMVEGETAEIEALVGRLREHFSTLIRTMEYTSGPAARHASPGIRVVS